MNILVLGGNGFIGSHVVDRILSAGHRVRIFDRAEDRYRGRIPMVEYVIANFDDSVSLNEALIGIDVVFHGISTTVPSTSNADPISDVQSNLVATLGLLNAMQNNGVKRIVYLSSGGTVYGQTDVEKISEEHPANPICSYGIVKLAIEKYLFMYQMLHGFRTISLRASNPYGERQGHLGVQGVIGTFLHRIANDREIEVWGDGRVVRDYIYVGDLADICLKSIASDKCGVYNIGGGRGHSVKEIVECLLKVTASQVSVTYKSARSFDVERVVLDISLAKETFNWQPKVSLTSGIEKTWFWLNSVKNGACVR